MHVQCFTPGGLLGKSGALKSSPHELLVTLLSSKIPAHLVNEEGCKRGEKGAKGVSHAAEGETYSKNNRQKLNLVAS